MHRALYHSTTWMSGFGKRGGLFRVELSQPRQAVRSEFETFDATARIDDNTQTNVALNSNQQGIKTCALRVTYPCVNAC